ncbi:MAG: cellulase family glycosylhydrolase [Candidatus Hermodarchaeota archaeon]
MKLHLKNEWFIDKQGRKVLLRGVNLGGSSKVPFTPNGATHIKTDFSDHKDVSFVGRPFPLKDADDHFTRLKHWGFNCIRFLITWEAIEHKGPRQYDKEYLDYVDEVLKIAESYKFYTFIDPHQDVWSRMTGGDGAPGWTFEKVGLDFQKFDATDAALVMQYRYKPDNPNSYPEMHWTSNAVRFANGTMWTLFFGGKDFAHSCNIDGLTVQDYLQQHFFKAIQQVAQRIKENSYIIGFEVLNEPEQGWIEKRVDGIGAEKFSEDFGYTFTPLDAILTGSGFARTVGFNELKRFGIKETRRDKLNKNGISCWLENADDIWKTEGVWGLDEQGIPVILNNEYFRKKQDHSVNFFEDYLSPFVIAYTKSIRDIIPETIIFFGSHPIRILRGEKLSISVPDNLVNATHWYDPSVGTKRPMIKASYDMAADKIIMGKKNVQDMFIRQLKHIKNISKSIHNGVPTLIGEFGIPYDMNKNQAYEKLKTEPELAWENHIKLLSMIYNALDTNLLNSTQWNYTADNNNQWGDLWNLEDLSIFSKDQQLDANDINSGGRAIEGFCRPHFVHCAGIPLKMAFNYKEKTFYFEFKGDSSISAPTNIYVPKIQFPKGYEIELSDGEYEKNELEQLLFINIKKDGIYQVKILGNL